VRVLVVHNRYRSANPSGENRVVDDEVAQLRGHGVEVHTYIRDSDDIGRPGLGVAIGPLYSRSGVRGFRSALLDRPDVVHLHNVYPLISPYVVRVAHDAGIPVVQTVHNYRHMCAAGTFYRDGHACEDCLPKRLTWPAVAHGCYRGSSLQSLPMAIGQAVHRPTWRGVDRLLPVSGFVARKLVEAGFPPDRITVRHTGLADPGPAAALGTGAVYVGRLDEEKGLPLLLGAWRVADVGEATLTIVGDGPLRAVADDAAAADARIRVLGSLAPEQVRGAMNAAAVVVIPSRTYEGLPRVLIEAFAAGRPVLGTTVGAMQDLVPDDVGWTASPEPAPFGAALAAALSSVELAGRSQLARETFLATYSADVSIRRLVDVYSEVTARG
jgi:glycosyltransferase involved in cell wall biosynthesis